MEQLQKAIELYEEKRYESALFLLDDLLDKEPENHPALRYKGLACIEVKQYENALVCLEKAFKLNPTPQSEGELGVCYYLLKRYDMAQIHLIQSVVEQYNDYFAKTLEKALLSKHNDDAMLGLKLLMHENNPKDIYILRDITKWAQILKNQ